MNIITDATLTLAELDALKGLSSFTFFVNNRIREIDFPPMLPGMDPDAFIEKLMTLGILTYVGRGTKGRIFQYRQLEPLFPNSGASGP
jgi:hypothetical protein